MQMLGLLKDSKARNSVLSFAAFSCQSEREAENREERGGTLKSLPLPHTPIPLYTLYRADTKYRARQIDMPCSACQALVGTVADTQENRGAQALILTRSIHQTMDLQH